MFGQPRIDLLQRFPLLKLAVTSRATNPALTLFTLLVFVFAILTGLVGTPVGSRNFGIIFVWIVWWALLIVGIVPLTGRAWCAICPIPAPGEWLQRRSIVQRGVGSLRSLHWRWPRQLKNMWVQNIGFLLLATFSVMILTRPSLSSAVLLGLMLTALALSLLYDNRVFCRYVCPVSGFVGLYAMAAPIELRVRDTQTCLTHTSKDCVTGNTKGYGCPWLVYPGSLQLNTNCGLCMECLKACPKDNIGLFLRPTGKDLVANDKPRLDEAYKALIMLACALLYSVVLGGPWGWLKDWANLSSWSAFGLYAFGFWVINLLIVPTLFAGVTALSRWLSRSQQTLRTLFARYAYALVPLGLSAWIAFSVSFVLTNASYVLATISDPFGWGWDLLGTANMAWRPLAPALVGFVQTGVLIAGLLFSLRTAYQLAKQANESARQALAAWLPLAVFIFGTTTGFLWIYLG